MMAQIGCLPARRGIRRFPAALILAVVGLGACGSPDSEVAAGGAPAVKDNGDQESRQPQPADAVAHRPGKAAGQDRTGEDWPVFLGPRGTSVSGETGFADKWPEGGPPVLWEKTVGSGYSAPSVRGDRLVLHQRKGDREVVECFRTSDGQSLWTYAYESHFSDPYGYSNGPRCTPLLTENRCYTYGAEGKLLCLDLNSGEKIWMRDCLKDFHLTNEATGLPSWFFGVGCTPILEGDRLIVLVGAQPNSGVVAFDAGTGKTVWQNVGKETWDGVKTGWDNDPVYKWTGEEQLVSYSSPIAATLHGRRYVLCLMRQGLVSLDPQDGGLNFKYWFRSRAYESVNAARPVVVGDKVFLSAAYKTGSALLEINEDGQSYQELWRDPRNMMAHWSTPIYVDGYLYGFSGRHEPEATFRCLELKTGKVAWATTGFDGDLNDITRDPKTGRLMSRKTGKHIPWPYLGRGSLIKVDDKFIVLGERGTLALVRINPDHYEELSRTSYKNIYYPSWTAPVLSRKRLFLRDDDTLLCLDLTPPAP